MKGKIYSLCSRHTALDLLLRDEEFRQPSVTQILLFLVWTWTVDVPKISKHGGIDGQAILSLSTLLDTRSVR